MENIYEVGSRHLAHLVDNEFQVPAVATLLGNPYMMAPFSAAAISAAPLRLLLD